MGDWTKQTYHDRAHEAIAALHFLRSFPGTVVQPTSLYGGSQAGWIMPLAARITDQIAILRKRKRSWLVWLTILPGAFVLFLLLGEFLVPH